MYIFLSIVLVFILIFIRPISFIWDSENHVIQCNWWISLSWKTTTQKFKLYILGMPVRHTHKKWLYSSNRFYSLVLIILSGIFLLLSFIFSSIALLLSFIIKKLISPIKKLVKLLSLICAKLIAPFRIIIQKIIPKKNKNEEATEEKPHIDEKKPIEKLFASLAKVKIIQEIYTSPLQPLIKQLWKLIKRSKIHKIIRLQTSNIYISSENYLQQGVLSAIVSSLSSVTEPIFLDVDFEDSRLTWYFHLKLYWFKLVSSILILLIFFPYKNSKQLYSLFK